MSKLQLIIMIIQPSLTVAAQILRSKDTNQTGPDDEIAEAIEHLLKRIQNYLAAGQPVS